MLTLTETARDVVREMVEAVGRAASLLDDKILDADRHEDHVHFTLDEQG